MTLTPAQRAKALLLASKSIRRCDVARVLDMSPAQFDTAVHGDKEIINAFGVASKQAREAQPVAKAYEGAEKHCHLEHVRRIFGKRAGCHLEEHADVMRITCTCGSALAVLRHSDRPLAYSEVERIQARINACSCMRATRNKHKNRGNRAA